ncbi:hypothetical protein PQY76_00695 [bacterium]|jgi:hypothetical protein|nr:hypothetical protein [bacterium]|tara:strand:+ start:6574 stop:6747 length:174 start_codon:yes stop_codon:yes gene_type:complete
MTKPTPRQKEDEGKEGKEGFKRKGLRGTHFHRKSRFFFFLNVSSSSSSTLLSSLSVS